VKSRSAIVSLKAKISELLREITRLEKKLEGYEGKGIIDNMNYYKARQRAPRRMTEVITDILKNPPEKNERERTTPARKHNADLGI